MEKLIKSKALDYKNFLMVTYTSFLMFLMLGLFLCIILSAITPNSSLELFLNIVFFPDKNIFFLIIFLISLTTTVYAIVSWHVKKISSEIKLEFEDITVTTPNNIKTLYNLLNKNVVVDENNIKLEIMNFPDLKIEVLSDNNEFSSITIRKYHLTGKSKYIKRLKLKSDETYNYILSVNV